MRLSWFFVRNVWNQSGALKIIDRQKHIFKLAQGEYIAPEKIEQVLVQSTAIAQVSSLCDVTNAVTESRQLEDINVGSGEKGAWFPVIAGWASLATYDFLNTEYRGTFKNLISFRYLENCFLEIKLHSALCSRHEINLEKLKLADFLLISFYHI